MVCGLSRMWKTPKIKCLKSYIGFIFFFQSTTLHSLSTDQLYFTFKYKTIQSQHRLAALLKLPFFLMAAAIFFNGSFNKRISSIGMSIFHLTSTDHPNTLLTDEASCLRTAPTPTPTPLLLSSIKPLKETVLGKLRKDTYKTKCPISLDKTSDYQYLSRELVKFMAARTHEWILRTTASSDFKWECS